MGAGKQKDVERRKREKEENARKKKTYLY